MKKKYISPKTTSVNVQLNKVINYSGPGKETSTYMSGFGMAEEGETGDAKSRTSGSEWDEGLW